MAHSRPFLFTLLELYSQGAASKAVGVSTKDLGRAMGLSQQAISKHLMQMESEGLIARTRSGRRTSVLITSKGSDAVLAFYSKLKGAVEGRRGPISFRGKVFTGMGEGEYYVSIPGYQKQFLEVLGFEPYPGTLNLVLEPSDLELRKQLRFIEGLEIKGFRDGKRTYGPVKCFRALVEGRIQGAALVIERTHHGDAVLEVVSSLHLRKELSLRDGSSVSVTVYPRD